MAVNIVPCTKKLMRTSIYIRLFFNGETKQVATMKDLEYRQRLINALIQTRIEHTTAFSLSSDYCTTKPFSIK